MKVRIAIATLITAGAAFALPAAAAHAETECPAPGGSCSAPSSQVVGTGGFVEPAVQATQAAPSGASLPLTGGDVAGLSLIGIALVGGGIVLVRRTRTTAVESQD